MVDQKITLIGAGVIGLSLAALHLRYIAPENLTIMDTRLDLETLVKEDLPKFLKSTPNIDISKITVTSDLASAVANARIIQENGPENIEFKQSLWVEVEKYAHEDAVFWTSTTGIPASIQNQRLQDKSRLLVVHPFNPPHVLPLFEIVPSPDTSPSVVDEAIRFWTERGRKPVLVKKEIPGFVAGRLAWALFREAIHLVNEDVVTVGALDTILENSMAPRWAYAGPFKSFHAGGGRGGLEALLNNIGKTVQNCWDDLGMVNMDGDWRQKVFQQTRETYPKVDLAARDRANLKILAAAREERN